MGGTDWGLEVKGNQYRYYDESNIDRPWKPLSELQYITKGVVFDGKFMGFYLRSHLKEEDFLVLKLDSNIRFLTRYIGKIDNFYCV